MLNAQNSMLNRRRGYTLIEIMVVLTIGVILGTVGIVKYRDASKRQAVDAAAQKLISAFRKAQINAASGVKDTCGLSSLEGWQVNVNANSYVIQVKCGSSTHDYRTENIVGATATIPNTNPILFKVLNQGTNITGLTTITISNGTTSKDIVVTNTGEIR